MKRFLGTFTLAQLPQSRHTKPQAFGFFMAPLFSRHHWPGRRDQVTAAPDLLLQHPDISFLMPWLVVAQGGSQCGGENWLLGGVGGLRWLLGGLLGGSLGGLLGALLGGYWTGHWGHSTPRGLLDWALGALHTAGRGLLGGAGLLGALHTGGVRGYWGHSTLVFTLVPPQSALPPGTPCHAGPRKVHCPRERPAPEVPLPPGRPPGRRCTAPGNLAPLPPKVHCPRERPRPGTGCPAREGCPRCTAPGNGPPTAKVPVPTAPPCLLPPSRSPPAPKVHCPRVVSNVGPQPPPPRLACPTGREVLSCSLAPCQASCHREPVLRGLFSNFKTRAHVGKPTWGQKTERY